MVLSVCLHVCGCVYRLFRMNNETYSDSIQHQQSNQEMYTKRNGIQQNILYTKWCHALSTVFSLCCCWIVDFVLTFKFSLSLTRLYGETGLSGNNVQRKMCVCVCMLCTCLNLYTLGWDKRALLSAHAPKASARMRSQTHANTFAHSSKWSV